MSASTCLSLSDIAAMPEPAEASPPHFRHLPEFAFIPLRFSSIASASASLMAISWRLMSPEPISP